MPKVDWSVATGIVATLTFIVLIWQTVETRRAVGVAKKTLVSTFRPKIILRRVSLRIGTMIPTMGVADPEPWMVDFAIANIGGTKAHITKRSFTVAMRKDHELPAVLPYAPEPKDAAFSLGPGEEREFAVKPEQELIDLFRHVGTKGGYLKNQRTAFVYFFGYVHYKDDLGVIRKTFVLRHYDTETGRFTTVDDADFESAD
jgi:hypothetical protein